MMHRKTSLSCNRYFRPCSFIPFCDADPAEQQRIVDEMGYDEWSPLAKTVLDGIGNEVTLTFTRLMMDEIDFQACIQ